MLIPPLVPRIVRKIIPPGLRVQLRRLEVVRNTAAKLLSGTAHCYFPDTQFELFYDGYRNIGLGSGLSGFECEERNMVRKLLTQKRPKVIWDIGANIGVWSLFLTSSCAADAEIRCFEPDPRNLELLRLNMTKNQIANWIICPVAVSNQEGSATFFSDNVTGSTGTLEKDYDFIGKTYNASRVKFQVTTTTVDCEISRGARPPQFIKIDVEGFEYSVLQGAMRTLREYRPLLIFETQGDYGYHAEISKLFQEVDYQMFDPSGKPVNSPVFNTIGVPREEKLLF